MVETPFEMITLIRRLPIAIGVVAIAGLAGCNPTPVTITPPRVEQGGRALSIAVASNNEKRMVVATETGGLFRTFDGGASWQHLDNLPNFKTIDVAISSLNPDIIIATTQAQYRTINDGGIWRSMDGGATWNQASGWAASPSNVCTDRPSAYGISHMPLSRTFYVGTDCGLAISNDDGATWSNMVLDPNSPGTDAFRNRVRSVLVINRTSGVAAADFGLFHLSADGNWAKSQDVVNTHTPVVHAFASPWFTGVSNIFFHASEGQRLFLSTDSGASWSQITAPSVNNREAFVRVGRSLENDDSKFEVYYGDGAKFHRQTFSSGGPTGTGTWINPTVDHDDPSDVAFDLERRIPTLLSTDGGVHRTSDQSATWKLTGGGYGGFDALQISEIDGQLFPGPPARQDLYYGTQDNDLKASSDGGQTWSGSICCEGRFIRASIGSIDFHPKVTGSACGPCSNFVSDPGFANRHAWPNAPDGNHASGADTPFLISGDEYLQDVPNTTASPPSFDFFHTGTAGINGVKSFSLPLTPKGALIVAGPATGPTVYQGVQAPGALSNGGTRFGLFRATNIAAQAAVAAADAAGTISLGSLRVPIARYVVLGADPNNPNHLIAPDADSAEMKFSRDGGATWHPLPQLTQAVTGNSQYLFTVSELTLASVIAWDPYDSCHILVGTIQNGIIESTDGGNTWAQIAGSKNVTYVSSFYFPPTGAVWVSSDGRGLWTLNLTRHTGANAVRCEFPGGRIAPPVVEPPVAIDFSTGSSQPFQGLNDPAVCPGCSIVVVHNGWVTDLQMEGDNVREIAISGGTISQLDRSGREVPLAIPNVYRPGNGKLTGRIKSGELTGSRRIRALILEGTRLKAVIAADMELPFAPLRTPMVFASNATRAGASELGSGESVRVIGQNFVPASHAGEPVTILFDGEPVGKSVPVRDDGSFSIDIPLAHGPGELVVTAEQKDGRRLTRERAMIDVIAQDRSR
jgi:photosystem II stability/assembly factor-like uncharacterized protein